MTQQLILASSSPYRKELLNRITQNFICAAPDINENRLAQENAINLVERLAKQKALTVAKAYPNGLIIGSDQVCQFIDQNNQEQIIGKPKTHQKAVAHLKAVSGKSVTLQTGLALYDAANKTMQSTVVPFTVTFRELSDELIERYLVADQPYHCAGAVKAESLGILLISKMSGTDPNSLIGLPLIKLITMLNKVDYPIL